MYTTHSHKKCPSKSNNSFKKNKLAPLNNENPTPTTKIFSLMNDVRPSPYSSANPLTMNTRGKLHVCK